MYTYSINSVLNEKLWKNEWIDNYKTSKKQKGNKRRGNGELWTKKKRKRHLYIWDLDLINTYLSQDKKFV